MLFSIPEIRFEENLGVITTKDTISDYIIRTIDGVVFCYYESFRREGKMPKEFKTVQEAKDWIVNTHYPSQLAKYLKTLTINTANPTKDVETVSPTVPVNPLQF